LLAGKDSKGRATWRSYVTDEFGKDFKAGRASPLGPDDCTTGQAAEILDVTDAWIDHLIDVGALEVKETVKFRGKDCRILSKPEVESYSRERAARRNRVKLAMAFLREIVADGELHLLRDVFQQAVSRGIGRKPMLVALKKLRVKKSKPKFGGPWYCRLPKTARARPAAGANATQIPASGS